jgi:hypothetical protein
VLAIIPGFTWRNRRKPRIDGLLASDIVENVLESSKYEI